MKKFLLIPDSFKGTMSSSEICTIMKNSINKHFPEASTISIPVADGGEGSVDAFLEAVGGKKIVCKANGPLGEEMDSFYGILTNNIAVIEMASCAGLPLMGDNLDPENTNTFGVGQLINHAILSGCKKIIIGLGGSCTNDAGCGAAAACGTKFYDENGNEFVPCGKTLDRIAYFDTSELENKFKDIEIITMCDIDNPFYGPSGAAYVFSPQKGANESIVKDLDEKMQKLAKIIYQVKGIDVQTIPGSGAAGGMGGGMATFFSSSLQMGIETVLDTVDFDNLLKDTDLVLTGEGKMDTQSLRGKVVIGVAGRAKKQNIPVVAIVGDIGPDIEEAYDLGLCGVFSTNRIAAPWSVAKLRAKDDMKLTVDNLIRFLKRIR